jgi:hypothetical protein
MGLISIDTLSRPVVQVPSDTSCLRFLLREDGNIESIPVTQQQAINERQVVTLETGKNQSEDDQLEHVQNQLQQVLMQLRQQRNQFPQDATEVDVHVVTLGPDGQVQERVNRIISQTLESMENASAPVVASFQEVSEQEMAVQIALEEMGVVEDDAIMGTNSESVDHSNVNQSNVQNIVNVSEVDTGPLSPSVLSTAQIMQDIRNTPVQHTYASVAQYPNQTVAESVVISEVQNTPRGQSDVSADAVCTCDRIDQTVATSNDQVVDGGVLIMNQDGTQKTQNDEKQETIFHYEIVHEMPDGEPRVLEIQYADESGTSAQAPGSQVLEVQYVNDISSNNPSSAPQDMAVQYVEESLPQNQATASKVIEVQYVEESLPQNRATASKVIEVQYVEESLPQNQATASKVIEVQHDSDTDNKPQSPPPTSMMDYVINPDFSSQEYYNWLSSFVELCKVVPMPLDMDLFQKVSQVHKTLSDVLANPSGVLNNKDNFTTLMSISRDLGGIVNEHLTYVLKNLERAAEQT